MDKIKYSDDIQNLPTANYQPSYNELNIMNSLFQEENSEGINGIVSEFKDSAIIGLMFGLFNIPLVDTYIKKFIPFTSKSPYYPIAIKTLVFILVVWVIQNKKLFFNK